MKEHFNKKEILEKLTPVVENTAIRYNLIPLEISLEKENGHWFLRIFIYCTGHPVNHQDCENMSRSIGDLLDEIIPFKYYLEISSPGLDKKLKNPIEYQIFNGHNVIVKVKSPLDDTLPKTFKGKITGYSETSGLCILADENNREYCIQKDNIFTVKLNDIEDI